jgi:GNAT superfamily N-acetyltransferase
MIKFQIETCRAIYLEAMPLMQSHWSEIDPGGVMDFNQEALFALEDAGVVKCYTARSDRLLVGYLIYLGDESLYQLGRKIVRDMGLYVAPEFRKGTTAIRLMKYAEEDLRGIGIAEIFQVIPAGNESLGKMLEGGGYRHHETVFKKLLKE